MKNIVLLIITILFVIIACSNKENEEIVPIADEVYYLPLNSNEEKTISAKGLKWDESRLKPLLNFLEEKNSKGFMISHNGKIVVEQYFNNYTATIQIN